MPASLQPAAALAAGYPKPLELLPLTGRFAACLATNRDRVSLPALADQLVDVLERYVAETAIAQLDPRVRRLLAGAVGRIVDQVDAADRAKAIAAKRRRVDVRGDDRNEAFVIADSELDQQTLDAAGVSLPERVGTMFLQAVRS